MVNHMELWQLLQCSWKQISGKCNKKVSTVPLGDLAFFTGTLVHYDSTHIALMGYEFKTCVFTIYHMRELTCALNFFSYLISLSYLDGNPHPIQCSKAQQCRASIYSFLLTPRSCFTNIWSTGDFKHHAIHLMSLQGLFDTYCYMIFETYHKFVWQSGEAFR